MRASIVISTYNRAAALPATLAALDAQDRDGFEVIVVDDGSTDDTPAVLAATEVGFPLRVLRHAPNRGVSAGRNAGIAVAQGETLILLSDDLIVPPGFVGAHLDAQERFPDAWIVGGFRQLDEVAADSFGRFLESLEEGFEQGRKLRELEPGVAELAWPTARNLSLPAEHLHRAGVFDEQFRTCCEDQDLAQRAAAVVPGLRYLQLDTIECLHNDQAADLPRYVSFTRRGAADTARLVAKYPDVHGASAMVRANAPAAAGDGVALRAEKGLKRLLATAPGSRALDGAIAALERGHAPESLLWRSYRVRVAVALFAGWREGLG